MSKKEIKNLISKLPLCVSIDKKKQEKGVEQLLEDFTAQEKEKWAKEEEKR